MANPAEQYNPEERYANDNRPIRTKPRREVDTTGVTKPSVSDDFTEAQKQRLTSEQLRDAAAAEKKERRRQKKKKQLEAAQQAVSAAAPAVAGAKGVLKGAVNIAATKRTLRASWIAGGLCASLYYYQVIFWIISMAGLGIEAAIQLAQGEGSNVVAQFTAWLLDFALPTDALFVVGYIICTAIAFIQFLIVGGVFLANAVNPVKGIAFLGLIFSLTFALMPFLGIVPWAFVWIYFIYRAHATQA